MNEISKSIEHYVKKYKRRKTWHRITSSVAVIVMFITIYMLILPAITLEDESVCGKEEHIHADECYEVVIASEEKVLICEIEEHEHQILCYSDKDADVETKDIWEASLPDSISGIWSEDLISVAKSQLGYVESTQNYEVTAEEEIKGYTRYGAWYGKPYNDWSAMFAAFCLHYAEIPTSTIPQGAECTEWITILQENGIYKENSQYVPKLGDLIFISVENNDVVNRVGIVTNISQEESKLEAIIGDYVNQVQKVEFCFEDTRISGYVELPNNLLGEPTLQEDNAEEILEESLEEEPLGEEPLEDELLEEPPAILFAAVPLAEEAERLAAGTYNAFNLKYNETKDAFIRDDAYAAYYFEESPLGTAGSFHLVAFGTANLTTHTNGNVLANTLIASSNFGTNNYPNELSYVLNYSKINGGSASGTTDHILVVGSNNELGFWDGQFYINQTKIDRPYNIIADLDSNNTPFIDLNRVETEITGISARLASVESTGLRVDLSDQNNRYIELINPNTTGYYSISAKDFAKYDHFADRTLKMKGFSTNGNGTIVVNVDCAGMTEITLPDALVYIDGQEQGTNEVTEFSSGKVIWNFTNAAGVTIKTRRMTGMIIAPGATVTITRNLNGTVVAENINVEAESHRTDFTGDIDIPKVESEKAYVTIRKVDLGDFSNYLQGAKFEIQRWDADSGTYVVDTVSRETLETNEEGLLNIVELEYNTAYRLVEIAAPTGYVNKGTVKDFYISHTDTETYPITKPQDFNGSVLNNGKVIYIANEKSTIPEKEFISLTIEKYWYARDGQLFEKDDGSISVSIWQKVYTDESYTQLESERDYNHYITLTAPTWTETITELPKDGIEIINGAEQTVYYTYYVKEQHVNGYATTYENNEGITEGTIVINNRDIHIDYVLPETGGLGGNVYYILGVIVFAIAWMLLVIKEKLYISRRKSK